MLSLLRQLGILLIACGFIPFGLFGQTPARSADAGSALRPGIEKRAAQRTRQRIFQRLKVRFPDLQMRAMLDFYRENGPDLFAEIQHQCAHAPAEAEDYVRTLAEHFMELERVRRDNPEEYKRLLALEKLEYRARILGRQIQRLSADKDKSGGKVGTLLPLARARRELAELLTKCFETEQQNQQIEVNRLEAEVRELRRFLEERAANKEIILQQRFFQLAGEEWPRDENLKTADVPPPPPGD